MRPAEAKGERDATRMHLNGSVEFFGLCGAGKTTLSGALNSIFDLPDPETRGIFAIKERNIVIYIGQSQDCIRERLRSHLAGYDAQDIGEYLKSMDPEEKDKIISISCASYPAK